VVIRQVDQEPVSRKLRHIDFYQVDLRRPIHGQVPLLLVGEAPAVHQWNGVLVHELAQVDVEALPADLPEHLEASVADLTELGSHLLLKDVPLPSGVTLVTDPETIVAAIQRPRLAVEEEAATEAAAAEGEAAAAAAAAEGESAEAESSE
jgi:large subunit ribosomal protein L25